MSEVLDAPAAAIRDGVPCELRQGRYGLFTVRLLRLDLWAIQGHLADQVGNAPGLLEKAPVVIDPSALEQAPNREQAADLLDRLRAAGLRPIAIAAELGEQGEALAQLYGLPAIPPESGRRKSKHVRAEAQDRQSTVDDSTSIETTSKDSRGMSDSAQANSLLSSQAPASSKASAAPQEATLGPMYITAPVRSGQQIYARGRDLVITAAVSAGAEVIADGNIHVYGRLAGKALAGARGNEQARIFCLDFQPELVSIAGQYRLLESIPEGVRQQAVQVLLDGERLDIRPLLSR